MLVVVVGSEKQAQKGHVKKLERSLILNRSEERRVGKEGFGTSK